MDKATIQDKAQEMADKGMHYIEQQRRNVGDAERRASLAGGAIATLMALRRGGIGGLALGAVGGFLLYRGSTGHCAINEQLGRNTTSPEDQGLFGRGEVTLQTGITIDRKPEELYSYWRDFEHLPQFMRHLVDVTKLDASHSHWIAQAPFGKTLEWDSEVTEDIPNERIAWRSVEGSDIKHHGEIRFRPATGGHGTEVQVDMSYQPPGGKFATTMAQYFNGITQEKLHEDVRRFKQLMEAGEIPTAGATPASPPTGGSLRH